MRSPHVSLRWKLLLIWFVLLISWFEAPTIVMGSERLASYFATSPQHIAATCRLDRLRDLAGLCSLLFTLVGVTAFAWRRRDLALFAFVSVLGHVLLFSAANVSFDGAWALHEVRSSNRFEPQWSKLRRLQIIDAFSPTLYGYDPRARIPASCDSFDDFASRVVRNFEWRQESIECELRTSGEETFVIFAMHVASTWWSFGNRDAPDRCGSALENEENDWLRPSHVDAAAYLNSPIGCCTDMAYLLKVLLDERGIPNRVVCFTGHVFNEVQIDGVWRLADPTINALVDRTWDELYAAPPEEKIEVMVFPHPQLREQERPGYREMRAQFRLLMLQRMATLPDSLRRSYTVDLPAPFALPKADSTTVTAEASR